MTVWEAVREKRSPCPRHAAPATGPLGLLAAPPPRSAIRPLDLGREQQQVHHFAEYSSPASATVTTTPADRVADQLRPGVQAALHTSPVMAAARSQETPQRRLLL